MNTIFRLTLLLSLLLHVSIFAPILWQESPLPPPELAEQTIEFELLPQPEPEPVPEAIPPEDEPPPYKHTEDDISKTNTTDGSADSEPAKQPSASQQPQPTQPQPEPPQQVAEQSAAELAPTEQATLAEANDAEANETEVTETAATEAEQSVQEFKPLPLFASQTQLQPMSDDALDDSLVETPLNSMEAARARWFNQVLKEIENQVKQVWNKPAGINKQAWGEIRLELDPEGYLLGAWVHLPSGSAALDRSALQAIRSVVRYRIPQSNMSRYYRHLNFKYHGGEEEAS